MRAVFFLVSLLFFFGQTMSGQETVRIDFKQVPAISNKWISAIAQDQQGFIWIGTQDGLNRYDGYRIERFRSVPGDANAIPANWVRSLAVDSIRRNLWVGTFGGGASVMRLDTLAYKHLINSKQSDVSEPLIYGLGFFRGTTILRTDTNIYAIDTDTYDSKLLVENTRLPFVTDGNTLYAIKGETLLKWKDISSDTPETNRLSRTPDWIASIPEKGLLMGFSDTLHIRNGGQRTFLPLPKPFESVSNVKYPWVYGKNGSTIYSINIENHQVFSINTNLPDEDIAIQTMYIDREGLLWIGTNKGLYVQKKFNAGFKNHQIAKLHARRLLARHDTLVVAGNKGLFEIIKSEYTRIGQQRFLNALLFDGTSYWTGGNNGNMYRDTGASETENHRLRANSGNIYGIELDRKNRMWVGAWDAVHLLDEKGAIFHSIALPSEASDSEAKIIKTFLDSRDRLWLMTLAQGVYKIENVSDFEPGSLLTIKNYRYDSNEPMGLPSDIVMSGTEDADGTIWACTDNGLAYLDPTSDAFRLLSIDGRPFLKKVMAVEDDRSGYLWISTIDDGLYRYHKPSGYLQHYTTNDGLISNAFLFGSSCFIPAKNTIAFGTDEGIQEVLLDELSRSEPLEPVMITSFSVVGDNPTATFQPISSPYLETVSLTHKQNDFNVSFSGLQFGEANKLLYHYRLDDEPWRTTDVQTAYFTNVPYGAHNLEVTSSYTGQIDSGAFITQLPIYIKPPWYQTVWAYVLYAVLFLSILSFIYILLLRQRLAKAEAQKIQAIDHVKSKMYADISHEFRTPLTVIEGVTQSLLRGQTSSEAQKPLQTIKRNSRGLLHLVNQMLDLTSLDNQQMEVRYINADILAFIKKYVNGFRTFSEARDQTLTITSDIEELYMDFDVDKLQKIINNLLSNAIKFTPKSGKIEVFLSQVEQHIFQMKIQDSGKGIAKEELPKIFDRYYKTFDLESNLGSGIGMALTKELVQLLGGRITVESEVDSGTCFTLQLPIQHLAEKVEAPNVSEPFVEAYEKGASEKENLSEDESDKPTLLIVEDHSDIREYLGNLFQHEYRILKASNGQEGLTKVGHAQVDLIISDIRMPVMDGFEFCKAIKAQMETSHIPFVMVTAKTATKSRLQGYELGIDAYIEKPFNEAELQLILQNLWEKKQQQIAYYSNLLALKDVGEETGDFNSLDLQFIKEVQEFALDPQQKSGVQQLVKQLAMSRTQIHRKITSLTDMSITQYINHVRIEKAKRLLSSSPKTISEIAYECCFEDPHYFSKVFKKETGETPTSFRETQ
ncbi:hybrid sensor histidine kinase/response regulator transcription factor [Luteirhabdus pelagi]|uniref:hybrid sensor histidine kinase/response regulator transcription factor n=1 Tax=Luteirhabdus pelagi TaxID=2792783 RepID=UPI0019393395|nr:ATP-binding protein [Luteirhabdus pelagi]